MYYENKQGVETLKERGEITMKIANITEIEKVIKDRQESLRADENMYRTSDPMAAQVASWGIDLLDKVKSDIQGIAFEGTINQYKSPRTGN